MEIINSEEIDAFIWNHRDNGCVGIKGDLVDEEGMSVNTVWQDKVTGEEIEIQYECDHCNDFERRKYDN